MKYHQKAYVILYYTSFGQKKEDGIYNFSHKTAPSNIDGAVFEFTDRCDEGR